MKVVVDAGPLIAFAKIGHLDFLLKTFPQLVCPPAVFAETVTAGLSLGARDARLLETQFDESRIGVTPIQDNTLEIAANLGRGEEECLRLSVEIQADLLLIDDREARQIATELFKREEQAIKLQGTLGVIATACLNKTLPFHNALQMLQTIEERADIWIHPRLCRRVKALLERDLDISNSSKK